MNPSFSRIPVWVRYLVLDKLARLLRINTIRKAAEKKDEKEKPESNFERNGDVRFAGVKLRNKRHNFARPESEHLLSGPPSAESSAVHALCQICEDRGVRTLHLNTGLNSRRASMVPPDNFLGVNKNTHLRANDRRQSVYSFLSDASEIQDQQQIRGPERNLCACGTNLCEQFTSTLLHQQKHLIEDVRKLARVVEDQGETAERQEEWAMVAHIADTVFMYLFILVLVVSTVVIFTNVPEYDVTSYAS